jgi:hypothetical protein
MEGAASFQEKGAGGGVKKTEERVRSMGKFGGNLRKEREVGFTEFKEDFLLARGIAAKEVEIGGLVQDLVGGKELPLLFAERVADGKFS